jgi:outer membrane protein
MRQVYILLIACFCSFGLSAQGSTPWTLEKAVNHALDNNLQVKRLDNFTEIARLNLKQAQNGRLPTASGSSNIGAQFGRTIDPTTNTFNAQTIGFQGYNLNAGVTLYNGGLIRNNLRQAEFNFAAAEMDAKVTGNNIGLQVANSYLTIVLLKEQLTNSRAQLQLTNDQLDNTNRLISAGALPEAQRFDLVAQQAANERAIVDLENQVETSILGLRILLEVDFDQEFSVSTPELNPSEAQLFETFNVNEVYTAARGVQPTVLAAELRRDAAETGIEIAKSGLRPTVSLFGSLSTNFSTFARDFANPDLTGIEIVQGAAIPVVINGESATLAQFGPNRSPTFPKLGYFNQLNQNFGQSLGMALNVPIYSQGRNKINVQRAKVQQLNAVLDIEQADNQLRNDVELALNNLRGARQSYRAAEASEEAAQAAYDNAQRRFRAGAANSLDLVTATNRLEQAQTEFIRSKYQLIFNRQVIKFYLGQGFSLN